MKTSQGLGILSVLACFFCAPAFGITLKVTSPATFSATRQVEVGQPFTVKAEDVAFYRKVTWIEEPASLKILDDGRRERKYEATVEGPVRIIAQGGGGSAVVYVTVVPKGHTRPIRPGDPPVADPEGGTKKAGADAGHHDGSSLSDARVQEIAGILDKYKAELAGMGQTDTYGPAADDTQKAPSSPEIEDLSRRFLKELGEKNLSLQDLQRFKNQYMAGQRADGESVLFPGKKAWTNEYLAVERALMAGRTGVIQSTWDHTLRTFFQQHPEAVGVVYGQINIGSWVKNELGGLGFEGDIDFSSVVIDPRLLSDADRARFGGVDPNRFLVAMFESNLRGQFGDGMGMIAADTLLTPHGQATPDVFVCEWGQSFAELDMLARGSWLLLEPEVDAEGKLVTDSEGNVVIRQRTMSGEKLFWERALHEADLRQERGLPPLDPAKIFPQMTLDMEPMLSLEMLRHGIHDVEHGPFKRGQKIIKILKYLERSYMMNRKATTAGGVNPYEVNDPKIAALADIVVSIKSGSYSSGRTDAEGNPEKLSGKEKVALYERVMSEFAGGELTEANIDSVVNSLVARAEVAMANNADRALAMRLTLLARIEDEAARMEAVKKLWNQLTQELSAYSESGVHPPANLELAAQLAQEVAEGKRPPAELEQKGQDLEKLLADQYQLPRPVIERIMGSDAYLRLRMQLRKYYDESKVVKLLQEFKNKEKYPNIALLEEKVTEFNDKFTQSTGGSVFLGGLDTADDVLSIYDAYMSGGDTTEAMMNALGMVARIRLQEWNPAMGIPLGIYDSFKQGDIQPAVMATAFYYVPVLGQIAMISGHLARFDAALQDNEFYGALNRSWNNLEFDAEGRIVEFKMRNVRGDETHSEPVNPPGDRADIINILENPERLIATSPEFRYWGSLVPRMPEEFGYRPEFAQMLRSINDATKKDLWVTRTSGMDFTGYRHRIEKLRKYLAHDRGLMMRLHMLEMFMGDPGKIPDDKFTGDRQALLLQWEDDVQRAVWKAFADLMEAGFKASGSHDNKDLKDAIAKHEEAFGLGDSDLGKEQGLQSRVDREIVGKIGWFTSKMSWIKDENFYVIGTVYKHYIDAYDEVARIRKQIILEVWYDKNRIDVSRAQEPPMKILLHHRGSPSLQGDPDADLALAKSCLAAHMVQALKIRHDLEMALARPLDDTDDREHLAALGQLGFEIEHLIDDCENRAETKASAEVAAAIAERRQQYREYLDKLRALAPSVKIEISPESPAVGETGTATAMPENLPKGVTASDVKFSWLAAHHVTLEGEGKAVRFKAGFEGKAWLEVGATYVRDGKKIALASVSRSFEVKPALQASIDIESPAIVEENQPLTLVARWSASLPEAARSAVVQWRDESAGIVLGRGDRVDPPPRKPGVHSFRAELLDGRPDKQEAVLADASRSITVTAAAPPQSPDEPPQEPVAGPSSGDTGGEKGTATVDQPGDVAGTPAPAPGNTAVGGPAVAGGDVTMPGQGDGTGTAAGEARTYVFEVTAPSIWTRVEGREKLNMARQKATWKSAESGSSHVGGTFSADFTAGRKLSEGEIRTSLDLEKEERKTGNVSPDMAVGLQKHMEGGITPVTLGEYRGHLLEFPLYMRRGSGSPWSGYTDSYLGRSGHGYAAGPAGVIEFSYDISGGGAWNNTDHAFLIPMVKAGSAEAKAMVESLRLVEKESIRQIPYNGPALDGSDVVPLSVELKGPAGPVNVSKTCDVSAVVKGGASPYEFTWEGDHAGDGERVTFVAGKPGDYPLKVTVKDADGSSATAETTIKVEGETYLVNGVEDQVIYASASTIWIAGARSAAGAGEDSGPVIKIPEKITGSGSFIFPTDEEGNFGDQGPKLRYLFHASEPGIAFDPPESADGKTEVTFGRMGKIAIWAQVVNAGTGETIGEAEQKHCTVVAPGFSVTYEPASGARIGQEIKATIVPQKVGDRELPAESFLFKWETPASGERQEYGENGGSIGFVPRDQSPVKLLAVARVPHYMDEIAKIESSYAVTGYEVKARIVEHGVRSKVFDPVRKEFVLPPKGAYKADEFIYVEAGVEGEPKPDPVRYQWQVNPGTSISNEHASSPTLSRHESGAVTATVRAWGKDDLFLGEATVNATVIYEADASTPLTVSLKAGIESVASGETVSLTAAADGGAKPYGFQWQGIDRASNENAEAIAKKPGRQTAAVQVTDGKGKKVAASASWEVTPAELKVELKPDRLRLLVGGQVRFQPKVTGGKEPCQWKWNPGEVQWNGQVATLTATAPGPLTVAAAVEDAWGNRGEAEAVIEVEAGKIKITGLDGDVLLGDQRQLAVETDVNGEWTAEFRSEPAGVAFAAAGPKGTPVTATFAKPGDFQLVAEIRRWVGSKQATLAVSEPVPVKVSGPKFSIEFVPGKARVGEKVRAVIREEPARDSRTAHWTADWSAPVSHQLPTGTPLEFIPPDAEPFALAAGVRTTNGSLPLGKVEASFQAEPLEMRFFAQPGTTPIEAGATVTVTAELNGNPPGSPKFEWAWDNGTAAGAATGSRAVVKAGDGGSLTARVVARSARGGVIGRGEWAVPVKPSPMNDPAMVGKVNDLLKAGYAREKAGDFDGALADFSEAHSLIPDPRVAEHIEELKQRIKARDQASALLQKGYEHEKAGQLAEAVQVYEQAVAIFPDEKVSAHIAELREQMSGTNRAQELVEKGYAEERAGRLAEAVGLFEQAVAIVPDQRLVEHIDELRRRMEYTKGFVGTWNSNWGTLDFQVSGGNASGDYTHDKGKIQATLSADGRTMVGTWAESPSYKPPRDGGQVTFTLSEDGNSIAGRWGYGDNLDGGAWTGTRIKTKPEPPQTIPDGGMTGKANENSAAQGGVKRLDLEDCFLVDLSRVGGKKEEPRQADGVWVDDASWLRLKPNTDDPLQLDVPLGETVPAKSITLVTNLDNSHFLKQGRVICRMAVLGTNGSGTVELKAGVHTGEWNDGGGDQHDTSKLIRLGEDRYVTHLKFGSPLNVTGIRFDYVQTDAELHYGAAPGFIVRGITLVRADPGAGPKKEPPVDPGKALMGAVSDLNIPGWDLATGTSKNTAPAQRGTLHLTYLNNSSKSAHIIIKGFGEKPGPSNQIVPGGVRHLTSALSTTGAIEFEAWRDGAVISQATWKLPPGQAGATLSVHLTYESYLTIVPAP